MFARVGMIGCIHCTNTKHDTALFICTVKSCLARQADPVGIPLGLFSSPLCKRKSRQHHERLQRRKIPFGMVLRVHFDRWCPTCCVRVCSHGEQRFGLQLRGPKSARSASSQLRAIQPVQSSEPSQPTISVRKRMLLVAMGL